MRSKDIIEREFLGLHFAQMDETDSLEWILERLRTKIFFYVVTPNVDHIVQFHKDPVALEPAYEEADLRLCDSRVIALMGRCNRMDLPVVTGSGLTARLLSKPLPAGTRIAIVGGNDRQRAWLVATQPQADFTFYSPPMGLRHSREAQEKTAEFIERTQADIILITVGAPQSEMIAHLVHTRGLARGVALCVGASLEFITGEKRRAPKWIQAIAMEWAFRLLNEPRRLARRYLVDGPRVFSLWVQWMKQEERGGLRVLPTQAAARENVVPLPVPMREEATQDNYDEAMAYIPTQPAIPMAVASKTGMIAGGGMSHPA